MYNLKSKDAKIKVSYHFFNTKKGTDACLCINQTIVHFVVSKYKRKGM